MKVAVIVSEGLIVKNFDKFIPENTTSIISMREDRLEPLAEEYAESHGIGVAEFMTSYTPQGRASPSLRICRTVIYSDLVIAFWDGRSRDVEYVIVACKRYKVPLRVYMPKKRKKSSCPK